AAAGRAAPGAQAARRGARGGRERAGRPRRDGLPDHGAGAGRSGIRLPAPAGVFSASHRALARTLIQGSAGGAVGELLPCRRRARRGIPPARAALLLDAGVTVGCCRGLATTAESHLTIRRGWA